MAEQIVWKSMLDAHLSPSLRGRTA
jgi:hypothetical protein